MSGREVRITGIGLVSSLGEGLDAHWDRLTAPYPEPVVDEESFAPFPIHPLAPVVFDKQIPKKVDQRQMEPWQRIGVYAAGLALESAGVAGRADLLDRTHVIVAAGGGERDVTVDEGILSALAGAGPEETGVLLNEKLLKGLRPTLFLAQLSNLLAGNISIVHGVAGSSRTLMGEEAAGADAVAMAAARIRSGEVDLVLVGGAANAARPDMLLLYALGGMVLRGAHRSVWERGGGGGFIYGGLGAFLVLEAREHAEKRGARGFARLGPVFSERSRRQPGEAAATLKRLWARLEAEDAAILSGASGAEHATRAEKTFLSDLPKTAVRATGTMIGHAVEAQFPANLALAALALARGGFYPPFDESGMERPVASAPGRIVVTGCGHWRGEAVGLVERLS